MSFAWSIWSPLHLLIDGLLLYLAWRYSRRRLTKRLGTNEHDLAALNLADLFAIIAPTIGVLIGISVLLFFLGGVFAFARVAWTTATVIVPGLFVYYGVHTKRHWLAFIAALILVFKYYGEAYEPRNLEIERIQSTHVAVDQPLRILHLSDLQTDGIGSMHIALREEANRFRPHLIVFTGDVLNAASLTAEVQEYLRGFEAEYGAYFVTGNVDGGLNLATFCPDSGLRCHDQQSAMHKHGRANIAVLGLGLKNYGRRDMLDKLIARTPDADLRLLLAHYPDALYTARDRRIDFLFAGHTHGGQIVLPGFGPLVTLSRVKREIAAGGLHDVDGLRVLVSRGLGWEGHVAPRVRLFCRPHAIFLTIRPDAIAEEKADLN